MLRYRNVIFIFLGLTMIFTASADPVASGTVFEDRNRNGTRDAREEGIKDACVSNGRDVVRTDVDGRWALPASDDTVFFVIKPAHWTVPVNENQIPQFHYIHKPNGSPTLEAPGVPPTGPLPDSIDFPLYRQEEPARFQTIFFGDTQARGLREVNFIAHDVVEELIGSNAAFGVSLGDIVADDVRLFEPINQSIAQIGVPWYNTFGNHDNNRDGGSDTHSDETFERVYGPGTYAFEYGQVVFIGLDDIFFRPDGSYIGRFTDDQLAFVSDYLATVPRDRLVVLMMHIPIVQCENREDMLRVIEDRPHTFSISAHAHEQSHIFLTKKEGWGGRQPHHHLVNATVCGCWWCGTFNEVGIPHATMNDGAPNGYSIITFDGNRYTIRFKAARRPNDYQMNIYLPDEIDRDKPGETEILVNVFAGSERSKVEMSCGKEGDWIPLEQTRTIDPECLRMHLQTPQLNEEVFGWKMDYPSQTSHMWKGVLPATLSAGTHTITVRTTDMFGRTWAAHRIVRLR